MSRPFLHKKFIFNEKIDASILFSLYEEDYQYIEEIFRTTLAQLSDDLGQLNKAFSTSDIASVKKIVHKIKPAFGFVGLPLIQAACQRFEDECKLYETLTDLETPYYTLNEMLQESKQIISDEADKLKEYNANL